MAMDKLKGVSKAVAGFVVGVIGAIITRLMDGVDVIPSIVPFDWKGWLSLLLVGVVAYLGVYGAPRNKASEKQVEADVKKLPVDARQRMSERLNRNQ